MALSPTLANKACLALLQTVIDELPGSVYLVRGRDARLVLANRAAATVWGATWPEGQPMAEFLAEQGIRVLHADGRLFALEELAALRAVLTGEPARQRQQIIRRPDGTTLPVLVNAIALQPGALDWPPFNADGSCAEELEPAAIIVHQDVTAVKEVEHLKDEFISIAAHEIRSPLAIIKGFSRMLILQTERGKGNPLEGWQTEAIQDIDKATTRLIELTDDLLDVIRLQAGRLELRLEATDLIALTKRIAARLQAATDRHTIAVSTGEEHIISNVDQSLIEQVLTNIIDNAIKFSPDGGPIDITLRLFDQTHLVQLAAQDHGIGIPEAQHSRIFGRFTRADNARSRGIGGAGLGLYLSRELIERHNGHIWFESSEGQGSTFYIALPLT